MIDLSQPTEPHELELPYGLKVTVRPLTTAGMAAAQTAARRAVEAIKRQARERTEAGLVLDGLPDLSTEGERDGFYEAQLIRELAVRHVAGWISVELGGGRRLGRSAGPPVRRRSAHQQGRHDRDRQLDHLQMKLAALRHYGRL